MNLFTKTTIDGTRKKYCTLVVNYSEFKIKILMIKK